MKTKPLNDYNSLRLMLAVFSSKDLTKYSKRIACALILASKWLTKPVYFKGISDPVHHGFHDMVSSGLEAFYLLVFHRQLLILPQP